LLSPSTVHSNVAVSAFSLPPKFSAVTLTGVAGVIFFGVPVTVHSVSEARLAVSPSGRPTALTVTISVPEPLKLTAVPRTLRWATGVVIVGLPSPSTNGLTPAPAGLAAAGTAPTSAPRAISSPISCRGWALRILTRRFSLI